MARGRLQDALAHQLKGWEGLQGAGKVAVRLLAGQLQVGTRVSRDVDRDLVWRLEHRDQRRNLVAEDEAVALPELPDLVDRLADAAYGVLVRDPHLAQAERQAAAESERDPLGGEVVQGGQRLGQHQGMAGVRVERAGADPDLARLVGDRGEQADRLAFEIAVVDPDRLQARRFGLLRPFDRLPEVATRGEAEADRDRELRHRGPPLPARSRPARRGRRRGRHRPAPVRRPRPGRAPRR